MGTNTGTILAQRPKRRGAAGLRSFFSVVVFRETKMGQSQRGKAPPDPTEKKLLTHHQIARNRKRSARLAAIAANSYKGQPSTLRQRRPRLPRRGRIVAKRQGAGAEVERKGGGGQWTSYFSLCLNQQCVMRSTEWGRRAGNTSAKQMRTNRPRAGKHSGTQVEQYHLNTKNPQILLLEFLLDCIPR